MRAFPVLLFGLALVTAACSRAPEEATSPLSGAPEGQVATPSSRVVLDAAGEQAALLPFGMLRVAPVLGTAGGGATLQALRHARGPAADTPDLWLGVGTSPMAVAAMQARPGQLRIDPGPGAPVIEVTTTGRTALYRITAPPGEPVVLQLAWRTPGDAERSLAPARGRRDVSGALVTPEGLQLHLAFDADRSFTVLPASGPQTLSLRFAPAEAPLFVRLALSTVDHAAARAGLAEPVAMTFDGASRAAAEHWDEWLGRLSVSGDADLRSVLATDHYRVLAHFGDITDSDGRYRGPAGELRRVPPGSGHFGNLDLSSDAGALVPLLALLAPEKLDDAWDTLLAHERAVGHFPVVTSWGFERSPPEGAETVVVPALPVLAAVAARHPPGIRPDRALPAMIKAGTLGAAGGQAWSDYLQLGYYPADRFGDTAVRKSLAASEAHHAIAAMAAQLGETEVAQSFLVRSLFYRQLWDSRTGGFRGRNADRAWAAPTPDPVHDANLWVPARFDIDGLLELVGGRSVVRERLDAALSPGPGDVPASPPAFLPWLYAFSNDPGRVEVAVRDRLEQAGPDPSAPAAAARLFASLGLYPVSPSRGDYVLSLPAVESARLALGAAELLLEAPGTGGVLETAGIDGNRLPGRTVSHRRLVEGGVLEFERRGESD